MNLVSLLDRKPAIVLPSLTGGRKIVYEVGLQRKRICLENTLSCFPVDWDLKIFEIQTDEDVLGAIKSLCQW